MTAPFPLSGVQLLGGAILPDDPTEAAFPTSGPKKVATVDPATGRVRWELAQGSTVGQQDGLVSGGQVVYKTGLTFTVSAASYYIGGVLYQSLQQDVTLAAADPTNPRIDVIAVDVNGDAVVITGTPAASPAEPDIDEATQLQLTFVLVGAGATTPTGITTTTVYQEDAGTPTEWDAVSSSGAIVVNSASSPLAGTVSIEATGAVSGDRVDLSPAAPVDVTQEALVVLSIKSKATWPTTRSLRVSFRNASGGRLGSNVLIRDFTYGFNSSLTTIQQVAIPVGAFGLPAGTLATSLRLGPAGSGAAIGWWVDSILLQRGVTQPASGAMVFVGTWSSTVAYQTGQVVIRLARSWVALGASTNLAPESNPAAWQETGATAAHARPKLVQLAIGDKVNAITTAGLAQGGFVGFEGTLQRITLVEKSGTACTCQFDLKINGTSIFSGGGTKPNLAASTGPYTDTTLTSVTLGIAKGDYAEIILDSVSGSPKLLVIAFEYKEP